MRIFVTVNTALVYTQFTVSQELIAWAATPPALFIPGLNAGVFRAVLINHILRLAENGNLDGATAPGAFVLAQIPVFS